MINSDRTCKTIRVPAKACYVRLSNDRVKNSHYLGRTSRGEMFIVDFDSDGYVVGIELVGDGKPCQES